MILRLNQEYLTVEYDDTGINSWIEYMLDEYSLNAEQSYTADIVYFTDDQYLILLSLADIYDDVEIPNFEEFTLNNFIGILYNKTTNQLDYYFLERNFDGSHHLYSLSETGDRTFYGFIKNDKKEFVENIKQINGID